MSQTDTLTTERIGARVYVAGNTFALKDRLKSIGCHWDGERRQWWIGAAKEEALAKVLASAATLPIAENLDDARIYAKVRYKGRTYYEIGRTRDDMRSRLATLDGSLCFWADAAACETVRTYEPREYRGHKQQQTLGGLRRFRDKAKEQHRLTREKTPDELKALGWVWIPCWECGRLTSPDRLDSTGYCGC